MNTHNVIQDFVVTEKEVYVGLEDSKKTWKIAVRSDADGHTPRIHGSQVSSD